MILARDVCQTVHTCDSDPQPHPVTAQRTVTFEQGEGAPIRNYLTTRCVHAIVTVVCVLHEPVDRTCPDCRITTTHRVGGR